MIGDALLRLLYPPKCVLCGGLLQRDETDLCRACRRDTEAYQPGKEKISFVASRTILWYYKDDVRESLLRYKFSGHISYAQAYGRLLAMKLAAQDAQYDLITWVPISAARKRRRGYDQVELIATAVAKELGTGAVCTLKKIRNNKVQSSLAEASERKANVLGVYAPIDPELVRDKQVLLLDDILTTGATVSECARVLLTAGAAQVHCAAVAGPSPKKQ